jgi:hypothetical protein
MVRQLQTVRLLYLPNCNAAFPVTFCYCHNTNIPGAPFRSRDSCITVTVSSGLSTAALTLHSMQGWAAAAATRASRTTTRTNDILMRHTSTFGI